MNTSGLAKMYDKLTPRERLPLIAAATARGDATEANRLVQTSPQNTVALPDYYGLGEGLEFAAFFYLLEQLDVIVAFQHALGMTAEEDLLSIEEAEPRKVCWWGTTKLAAYVLTARIDGWRQFCSELGIDSEVLLEFLPGFETVRRMEDIARDLAFTTEEATEFLTERSDDPAPTGTAAKWRAMTPDDVARSWREFLDGRVAWWTGPAATP